MAYGHSFGPLTFKATSARSLFQRQVFNDEGTTFSRARVEGKHVFLWYLTNAAEPER